VLAQKPDLVVVGAGIVGLAHAVEAIRRGLSVVVIERDERAVGASVRNFGHACVTGQLGDAHRWALAARHRWLELASTAGYWTSSEGAVVAARREDEMAVIEELVASGHGDARVLDRVGMHALVELSDDVIGGAHLPLDIRVNPREAVASIAAWVERQPGAEIRWRTSFLGLDGDTIRTSRGDIVAGRAIVCVGHDVDRVFPDVATEAGVQRCELHMLRVANPRRATIAPAVLSATSLLRYDAFAAQPAAAGLRARFDRDHADLLDAGLNLMFTQLPDGDLTIGDTHGYAVTLPPYRDEAYDELVLHETSRLLGVPSLTVKQRWRGVYASAPRSTLVADVSPTATVVSVTSGIGMTIGHGLAIDVLDRLLGGA
jgi:FAD dependent oxidoreductase TIGR03364